MGRKMCSAENDKLFRVFAEITTFYEKAKMDSSIEHPIEHAMEQVLKIHKEQIKEQDFLGMSWEDCQKQIIEDEKKRCKEPFEYGNE